MKNLLIVNQSANYLMEDIARAFKYSGKYEKVVLMVGNPENVDSVKDIGIEVVGMYPYKRTSFKSRFKSWVIGAIQIVQKVRRNFKDYELFLVSNPPTIHLLPYFCKNKYSALVYDVYPEGIVTGNFVTEKNIIYKIWSRLAKYFYKRAQHVYVISEGMAERLERNCESDKIEIVPLWYNNQINRVEKEENLFIKQHGLKDYFIVLYSGNLGKDSNISILVDLALKCKEVEHIKFVVIGEGMEKQAIIDKAKQLELSNILFLPYQPADFLSHSLSSADLAYVSVNVEGAKDCVPSKTFNLLNVETPLLCVASPDSEIAKIIKRYDVGQCFDPSKLEDMSSFVIDMAQNPEKLTNYKDNVKKAKMNFSSANARKFSV